MTIQVVERTGGHQYTLTIPRRIAEALRLHKGEAVNLSISGEDLIIRRQQSPRHP